MAAAARRLRQQGGIIEQTFVYIRGRTVNYAEIRRYARRKGLTVDTLAPLVTLMIVQDPSANSAMLVESRFRRITSIAAPDPWRFSQHLLMSMRAFVTLDQIFQAKLKFVGRRRPAHMLAVDSLHPERSSNEIHELLFFLASACQHALSRRPDLPNREMEAAMTLVPKVVDVEDSFVGMYK